MLGNSLFACLDDLIIVSNDPETHLTTLKAVPQRLQEADLKVKLSTCKFLKEKIKFVGHEVHGEGIHISDDKITAVTNFHKPQSADNVRSFLGLEEYYRPFTYNFAAKAAPLTRLLRKQRTFHWDNTQEKSFQELKYALTHTPVLAFPDY